MELKKFIRKHGSPQSLQVKKKLNANNPKLLVGHRTFFYYALLAQKKRNIF